MPSGVYKRKPLLEKHKKNLSEGNKNRYIKYPYLKKQISDKIKAYNGLGILGQKAGEKNHQWRGGLHLNPYPKEFNSKLKLKIRERDNFTCCLCGKTEREELEELNRILAVNHIDFDKNNNKESNLNTLCLRCNVKINRNREYWTYYFQ